jgi:hypothetical protein
MSARTDTAQLKHAVAAIETAKREVGPMAAQKSR